MSAGGVRVFHVVLAVAPSDIRSMPLPRWVDRNSRSWLKERPRACNGCTRSSSAATGWPPVIDRRRVQLLRRSGPDWTAKYPATAAASAKLPVKTTYIDGELAVSGPKA